jgi:4-amino-4-deoxy-L-arabinose transferase-like glycosyltransferase
VRLPARRTLPVAAVLIIVSLGAALRFWTIGAGAPYEIGVDEPVIVNTAVRMIKTGDFNPHFFDYPGLTYYLQAAVASARFLTGAMNREWQALSEVWAGDFYVWARAATALLGTLTIVLVYRAGLRGGTGVALFGALVLAVLAQHVRESHFALTDVPMTFFVALTLVQSLSAAQSGRPIEFLLAGLAAGLAAATKYNGGFAVLMPLVAATSTTSIRPLVAVVGATAAGATVGFLAGAPYTVIDLPGFLNGFARLMQFYNANPSTTEGLGVYSTFIVQWFGWPNGPLRLVATPALVVIGIGAVAIAREMRDPGQRPRALIALVFPLVYLWFISAQSLRYGRYALPLAPFLALWFGVGATAVIGWAARWRPAAWVRPAGAAMLVALLALPLAGSVAFNRRRVVPTPTVQAARWLMSQIQPGEAVAIEGRALMQLPPTKARVFAVNRLIEHPLERYWSDGVVYLVASSAEYGAFLAQPTRDPARAQAYASLFRETQTVQVFQSRDTNRWPTIRILKIVR